MSRSRLLSRACMIWFSHSAVSQVGFGRISNAMFVGFWSGAGRFVLKSRDVDLRTNLGTSAREFISFSQIENLPDLTVDALTAPTALYEKSTLMPFCLVRHSSVFTTGLFPGGSDPSYLSSASRLALQRLCLASGFVFSGRFPVLALPLCSLGWFPVLSVFSSLIMASSCSSGM